MDANSAYNMSYHQLERNGSQQNILNSRETSYNTSNMDLNKSSQSIHDNSQHHNRRNSREQLMYENVQHNFGRNNSNDTSQQHPHPDYHLLPPPLVKSSSSCSSQSSYTGQNNDYLHSDNNNPHQPHFVLSDHQHKKVNDIRTNMETQDQNKLKFMNIKEEKSKRSSQFFNLLIDHGDSSESNQYWPSLFSTSPRSFLLGKNPDCVQND